MAIRAIAYHESVAMERLEKYFDGESGSLSGSTSTKCYGCDIVFAVVLPARDHPDNAQYVQDLTRLISEDSINGMPQEEYVLESMK
jgi:hypothetical protein